MRDVANEAEDIIELFMWKQIRISKSIAGLESIHASHLSLVSYDLNNLKKAAEKMESIAAEAMEIKNNARTKDVRQLTDSSSVSTLSSRLIIGSSSAKLDTAMVGFEDDLTAIKGRLCGESRKLQFIPINGMGGIGKTIIAKKAYDDQLIVERFQIRAWVTVSQDYQTLEILSSLVVSVGGGCSEHGDESKMLEIVHKSLKWRRYLIVMEDLVKRSLVLVTKRKANGRIKSCSLHDLVRELCIRKAQQEKFLVCIKDNRALEGSIRNQRRVITAQSTNLNCLRHIYGLHIHTIICTKWAGYGPDGSTWDSLCNTKLLRVLGVVHELPWFLRDHAISVPLFPRFPQVIEIFHLRHLTLPSQVEIPAAISNLENLQTLIIQRASQPYTRNSISLPFQVWRIQELRHLILCYFDGLPHPEAALSPLENLRTLSHVQNFICTQEILLSIPNLKKLGISYSGDEKIRNCQLQNLVYLHKLEKLTLEITGVPLETLKPVFPVTLKKLTLSGEQRFWKDMGIIGLLPNLEVLKLRNGACVGGKWETSEEEFPQLKFLVITGSDLQHWITESSHFPSLKSLMLHYCWNLEEIPDEFGEIPTLELIEIFNGKKSLMHSAKQIQKKQKEYGNDALQIHCWP